ncbi:glycosyltransferase family 2 protein [Nocardia sp. NPDC005978]|uniref:glycosyltransferase n=1 Tax=Nocardia sp. NPDC005978 TaxID=3156725 RepID=UPI0033B2B15A
MPLSRAGPRFAAARRGYALTMIVSDDRFGRLQPISDVVVVVPVRDEEQLLPHCVRALRRSAAQVRIPVRIQLVLDACTDGSTQVADALAVDSLIVDEHNVGAARAAGFAAVRSTSGPDTWFATTDADSQVDRAWLSRQLHYARHGADLVAGVVSVADWDGYSPATRLRYQRQYEHGGHGGHGHIHGANLGFRAEMYWSTGGFLAKPSGEDVEFVTRAQAAGRTIVWADDVVVSTSGRRNGRAPGGFAAHLRTVEARWPSEVDSA